MPSRDHTEKVRPSSYSSLYDSDPSPTGVSSGAAQRDRCLLRTCLWHRWDAQLCARANPEEVGRWEPAASSASLSPRCSQRECRILSGPAYGRLPLWFETQIWNRRRAACPGDCV